MAETPQAYFTVAEEHEIVSAIRSAEKMTSGEIRVHVSQSPDTDSLEATKTIFEELRMYNTQHRNGVLIHISLSSKTFSIFGDEGINQVVSNDFWESTKDLMQVHFKKEEMVDGICAGVRNVGIELKQHFPIDIDDKNELSDDISYD